MGKIDIQKALWLIDNTINPYQLGKRDGYGDHSVDEKDLSYYWGADLSSFDAFRKKYPATTNSFYSALATYEKIYGNSDGRLENKNDNHTAIHVQRQTNRGKFHRLYPEARRASDSDVIGGRLIPDPYRWLEDSASPEVQKWRAGEDRLARATIRTYPGRDALVRRMRELYHIESIETPREAGGRLFYKKTEAGREVGLFCYRDGQNGEEHVLIDPLKLDASGNVTVGATAPNPDGTKLVYESKANNADEASLRLIDVSTGRESEIDRIDGIRYASVEWSPNGEGFYYTWWPTDPSIRAADRAAYQEIRFHKVGTDPKKDATIFEKSGDAQLLLSPHLSSDGRWLFVNRERELNSSDIFYRDLKKPGFRFNMLFNGNKDNALARVAALGDHFYILTNSGAPNWKVDRVRTDGTKRETIVAERKDTIINDLGNDIRIIGGRIILRTLHNATSSLEIRRLDGKLERNAELPGLGAVGPVSGDPSGATAYFTYESFIVPKSVYSLDIATGRTSLISRMSIPIDFTKYTTEQVSYPSKDGTMVSMFLVHKVGQKPDGKTPVLMTGYGGFNASLTPRFFSWVYPWLEAGGVFAVPNLRGGGEYGENWHRGGMLANKQNTFDDMIAASEFLMRKGYTTPDHLALYGGSNGGLTVGAVLTQRPDLFKACATDAPVLDMLRYHLYGDGQNWMPEYGDPASPQMAGALLAYSPLHNVRAGAFYPSTLLISFAADDRVGNFHENKMAAALQFANASDNPILLFVQPNAGHKGPARIEDQVQLDADMFSFLMQELGMQPGQMKVGR